MSNTWDEEDATAQPPPASTPAEAPVEESVVEEETSGAVPAGRPADVQADTPAPPGSISLRLSPSDTSGVAGLWHLGSEVTAEWSTFSPSVASALQSAAMQQGIALDSVVGTPPEGE